MKKTGIIKAISPKSDNRNAFTLENEQNRDGKDIWFNGYSLVAEKGDEIEFELTINEDFNNFSKLKILNHKNTEPATKEQQNIQLCNTEIALELTRAVIGQKHENIVTVEIAVGMFTAALSKLNAQSED